MSFRVMETRSMTWREEALISVRSLVIATAPQTVPFRAAFWIICVAWGVLMTSTATADELATLEEIRVGIDGVYKLGQWTPVQVSIRTGNEPFQGHFVVQTDDPNGVAAQYVGSTIAVAPNSVASTTTYVKFGQPSSDLRVMLQRDDGRQVARQLSPAELPAPLPSDQQLLMSLGNKLNISRAKALRSIAYLDRVTDHHITNVDDLPRHWLGYSSVDVLLLTSSNEAALAEIDQEQWVALRRWVELGGTAIACGATRAVPVFGSGGPLAWMLPGEIKAVVNQRQTTGIEQFAEASRRLDQVGTGGLSFSLPMAVIDNPRGKVEATEGFGAQQSPAVIRATTGLGRIIFVTFDLDLPPFSAWQDQPRLLGKLLSFALDDGDVDDALRTTLGPVTHVGFTDLVGQLRHALDQFPGVRLVRFSWIAGLIGALYRIDRTTGLLVVTVLESLGVDVADLWRKRGGLHRLGFCAGVPVEGKRIAL